MSKQTEALKLALEAMTYADACLKKQLTTKDKHQYAQDLLLEAGTAIRKALAEQPAQQQEPVAYASDVEFDDETEIIPAEQKGKLGTAGLRIALYLGPPAQRKPLPAHEIVTMYDESPTSDSDMIAFARAIEAAHGIKGDA